MTSTTEDLPSLEQVSAAAADRMTFFSDAVVAIAITLLALNLPLPQGGSNADLARALNDHARAFITFGISFGVIAANWLSHHSLFRYLIRADAVLLRLNFVWLLSVVLTPWAADLLAGDSADASSGGQGLRFAVYAAVLGVSYLSFLLMVLRMRGHHLLRADTPPELPERNVWSFAGLSAAFLLSIPLFFVTEYAWVMWAIAPTIVGLVGRRWRRRHGHSPQL